MVGEQTTLAQTTELNNQFQKIIVTLVTVCIVFMVGSFILGTLVYYLILIILGLGIYWIYTGKLSISELLSYLGIHQ
jgi:magnesium-transporting ATPase (P-type)